MKKRLFTAVSIVLVLAAVFAIGAGAQGMLSKIDALLNYGIKIKYNGQVQEMFDANGIRVYPITYNGTTYLPVRAVANMFGETVDWDAANNTVLLGNNGEYIDFIENFFPYYIGGGHFKYADGEQLQFGGKVYNHFVKVAGYPEGKSYSDSCSAKYELNGKYSELVIDIYLDDNDGMPLKITGDNGKVLAELNLSANSLTRGIKIPVYGVNQISIQSASEYFHYYTFYILDAKIK